MIQKYDRLYMTIGAHEYLVEVLKDTRSGNVGLAYVGRYDWEGDRLLSMSEEEVDAAGSPWKHLEYEQRMEVLTAFD